MSEAILVGGSKDGTVTEYPEGLMVMNQMTFDGGDKPTSIQTYSATGLEDAEGRAVFAVTATYSDEQVDEIWELLSEDARQEILDIVAEMDEEEEEEEETAEEETVEEEVEEPVVEQEHVTDEEPTNDEEKLEVQGTPVEREEEANSDEDSTGEVQEDEPVEEVEEEE